MEPTKYFLPPGFRFHPTDEELIVHYLVKKSEQGSGVPIIAEVDLYKYNPWDLPAKAHVGEEEWYFLTPRDRKYPNGSRPNRAAASGYWKATGTDKPIFKKSSGAKVGIKKALVFYEGKAPRGVKTDWIMHEYRLATNDGKASGYDGGRKSLRMDDWVLCRIYKKAVSANKAMKMNDFTRNVFEPSYEIAEPSGIDDSIDSFVSRLSDQRLDFEEGTGCYQVDSSFPEHLMSSDCVINELEKVFLKRQDLYPQSPVKTPRFRLDSTPSRHHGMRII